RLQPHRLGLVLHPQRPDPSPEVRLLRPGELADADRAASVPTQARDSSAFITSLPVNGARVPLSLTPESIVDGAIGAPFDMPQRTIYSSIDWRDAARR